MCSHGGAGAYYCAAPCPRRVISCSAHQAPGLISFAMLKPLRLTVAASQSTALVLPAPGGLVGGSVGGAVGGLVIGGVGGSVGGPGGAAVSAKNERQVTRV